MPTVVNLGCTPASGICDLIGPIPVCDAGNGDGSVCPAQAKNHPCCTVVGVLGGNSGSPIVFQSGCVYGSPVTLYHMSGDVPWTPISGLCVAGLSSGTPLCVGHAGGVEQCAHKYSGDCDMQVGIWMGYPTWCYMMLPKTFTYGQG